MGRFQLCARIRALMLLGGVTGALVREPNFLTVSLALAGMALRLALAWAWGRHRKFEDTEQICVTVKFEIGFSSKHSVILFLTHILCGTNPLCLA